MVASKSSASPRQLPSHVTVRSNARGAIATLNAGFMHDELDQIALGVGDDVALAALDLLACVIARGPPLFVVFSDWLSITPAVGVVSRPVASRDAMTRAWLSEAKIPVANGGSCPRTSHPIRPCRDISTLGRAALWTQRRGSRSSLIAYLLRVLCRFHTASPRVYNVAE
jgi:hypothetical protein